MGLLRVPLRTPFKTALRTVAAIEDVVVIIDSDDGRSGVGAAAPTAVITGDTRESIIAAIGGHIGPALIDRPEADIDSLCRIVQSALPHNSSAKAAVEIALYDLWAQAHGEPLYRMLGTGQSAIRTDITISLNPVEEMVADSLDAVRRGFTALKIKLGSDGAEINVERVSAIHAALAGRASLRLDANQAWSPEHSVKVLLALESTGVAPELIEQPVPAADLAGLKYVSDRVQTPVMADESAFTLADVEAIIQQGAASIINIKLMKTGGLSQAMRIADLAHAHGLVCMMGCMLESSISVAAAVHLAVARPEVITRIDLDPPALCREDPVRSNVRFDEAELSCGDAPGLGIASPPVIEPI